MRALIALFTVLCVSNAHGMIVGQAVVAPTITSVSGTLTHGSTLTITGSSLGTKTTAAPALWDNFEDAAAYAGLSDGNTLPFGENNPGGATEPWYDADTTDPPTWESSDPQRSANSTAYITSVGAAWIGQPDAFGGNTPTLRRSFYMSWWMRHDAQLDVAAASQKVLRAWDVIAGTGFRLSWAEHLIGFGNFYLPSHNSEPNMDPLKNAWHHMEFWIDRDAGRIQAWVDGKLLHDYLETDYRWLFIDEGITDGPDVPDGINMTTGITPMQVCGLDPSGGEHTATRHDCDDVYLDETRARVVLSDQAVWDDAVERHVELQIPTSWTDTQIEVTLNQGSFGALGSNLYVYVINYKGRVSNGVALPIQAGALRSNGRGF